MSQDAASAADAVIAVLLSSGRRLGQPGGFRADLALDTTELFTFIGATQPREWERLIARHDDADVAQRRFARRVAAELDDRGAPDVLDRGVADQGIAFRLTGPAHGTESPVPHRANRLSVVQHVHYAPSRPSRSLDLVAFVNGIPVATAQVADAPGATALQAAGRFSECDPRESLLRRAVVHLAVGPDGVLACTRLAGPHSRFVPLSAGAALPGRVYWSPELWLEAVERLG